MSHLSRRGVLSGAAGVSLAAFTAACSGGSNGKASPSAPAERKPGQKIKLEFWSWVPGIDKAVDLWNSQNPDVHVILRAIPAGSAGGYAKMHSAIKAGNAPDLAQVEYQEIPSFLLDNGLVEIGKYGAGDQQDKFIDWQWRQGVFGNNVYAIPQASGPMGFFYRSDIFDSLGLQPPKTWDDFEAAAKKIHSHNPKMYISTFPPGNSAWFTSLAWQAGAKWFGTQGDAWTVQMDDPVTLKVARYWDRLRTEGVIKTEPDFANGWYKDLQDGNVVGWVTAQWGDAILSGNAAKTAGKWRAAPIPQWPGQSFTSANWGGSSTALLRGAKFPKDALKFAVWLNTDPKSIDLLIKGGYGWPAAKNGFSGSALDEPSSFFGGQNYNQDVFTASDDAIDESWAWIPTIDACYQHLDAGFQDAVGGKGSFESAVKDAQQQTMADLKTKGLKVAGG